MKTGVFGGSFDPPHKAHEYCLKKAIESAGLDRVIVIPAYCSPFKDSSHATGEDRLNMCRLAFESDCVSVSDRELKKQGKSYTVDTLRELKSEYPGDELYFITGTDTIYTFHAWRRADEILRLAKLLVVSRSPDDDFDKMKAYVSQVLHAENRVSFVVTAPFVASSTAIREALASGGDCSEYLNEYVYDYIKEKKLYGTG